MAVPKISKVLPAPTPICLYLEDVMKLALEIAELGGFTNLYEAWYGRRTFLPTIFEAVSNRPWITGSADCCKP